MRSLSSSKQQEEMGARNKGLDIEKVNYKQQQQQADQKAEPHLSGAYIRSLVKQLTSSRANNKDLPTITAAPVDNHGSFRQQLGAVAGAGLNHLTTTTTSQEPGSNLLLSSETKQAQAGQQLQSGHPQHKKQVRRRLHISRPYQERLLNMAEARREIVTALKFHRAAMKQAAATNDQQHHQLQQPSDSEPSTQSSSSPAYSYNSEGGRKLMMVGSYNNNDHGNNSWRINQNSACHSSLIPSKINLENNLSHAASSNNIPCPNSDPNLCSSWGAAASSMSPPPLGENLNFTLPDQTLGLNLNFQDFNNVLYRASNGDNRPPSSDPPRPKYSFMMTSSANHQDEFVNPAAASNNVNSDSAPVMMIGAGGLQLHPALDAEEMAEIRSIGEKHQMEWDDTMNLVTSAWWFKFMKTMGPEPDHDQDDGWGGYHDPFDQFDHQVMEFPDWLNVNDAYCFHHQQQHFNHDFYCAPSHYYSQDPAAALPCMDLGEIEAMDEEWLA
ncbi:hypothetical protein RJ641_007470 [Dillenia turbinata]|uniref:Uncharacterized protein n=1 Tax=Dillenia turbinata TaxID=194707 RepID=A0AAN8V8U1_9MAGN